jgi:hypothetical protein
VPRVVVVLVVVVEAPWSGDLGQASGLLLVANGLGSILREERLVLSAR